MGALFLSSKIRQKFSGKYHYKIKSFILYICKNMIFTEVVENIFLNM